MKPYFCTLDRDEPPRRCVFCGWECADAGTVYHRCARRSGLWRWGFWLSIALGYVGFRKKCPPCERRATWLDRLGASAARQLEAYLRWRRGW